MGMLCDYFEAHDNDAAAEAMDRPVDDYLDGKGIEPTVSLGQLESLLTGRPLEEILADTGSVEVVAADDEQGVVRLGESLRQSVLSFDIDNRPELVKAWSDTEELRGFDLVSLHSFLHHLQDLMRRATTAGNGVYCLVSA